MNRIQYLLKYAGLSVISILVVFVIRCNAEVSDTITRTFDVKPGGTLTIDGDRGSIEIQTSSNNKVDVTILRTVKAFSGDKANDILKNYKIEFDQSGDNVTITGKADEGFLVMFDGMNKLQIRYKVTVPSKYNLDMSTAGGSIEVADLNGKIDASTAGGSLKFANISGSVDGSTAGGGIKLTSSGGDVDVKTAGGSIYIGRVKGNVEAKTAGGSIHIGEVYGTLEAKTAGGGISIDGVSNTVVAKTSGGRFLPVSMVNQKGSVS